MLYIPLHSNLVLFKYACRFKAVYVFNLYIPIWFYSNAFSVAVMQHISHFTFQSGSIQILSRSSLCGILYPLHSNLVLFKSVHIIPPIYTAWKALFCRPINKWFLQCRHFYNLSLFIPSKPLSIPFVDLPIFYSYRRSTTYFI